MDRREFTKSLVTGAPALGLVLDEKQIESLEEEGGAAVAAFHYKGKTYALGFRFEDIGREKIIEALSHLNHSLMTRVMETVLIKEEQGGLPHKS